MATPLFTPQNQESSKYLVSCAEPRAETEAAQIKPPITHLVARIVLMPLLTDGAASVDVTVIVDGDSQIIPSFLPTLLNAAIASSRSSRE